MTSVTTTYKNANGQFLPPKTISYAFYPDGGRAVPAQEAGVPDEELFYQFDALGNVVARLDLAGDVRSSDEYDAWGNLLARSGTADDPFGYKGEAGYYTDAETGLVLCTWRYYDPATGRWLTRDPIGYAGGINLYGYCGNDAVNAIDPLGLDWLDDTANFSAGFGDSLTFGITDLIREVAGVNDVVDHSGGWYIAGEATEMVAEVAVSGGSSLLKAGAKTASRKAERQLFRKMTKDVVRNGNELHHVNPLFGNPGGTNALFPMGGMPKWIPYRDWFVHGPLNTELVKKGAEHMGKHRRLRQMERIVSPFIGLNPSALRATSVLLRHLWHGKENSSCIIW